MKTSARTAAASVADKCDIRPVASRDTVESSIRFPANKQASTAGRPQGLPRCAATSPAVKFGKMMTDPLGPPIRPAMFETSLNESFARIPGDLRRGLILIADHTRNTIPADYGTLGLPPEQFERHIAYD